MLRRLYYRSPLYLLTIAHQLTKFYQYAFNRTPNLPSIPWTSLRYVNSILTYQWDIYEEMDMLDVIQEDTTELRTLYNKLQGLLDFAV